MLVLFTDLLDDIRLAIKNIKERLDKKKNTVYTKTGSATRVVGKSVTLCTISGLPAGKYLVLAHTESSISADLTIISSLSKSANCELISGPMRGTMISGGGVSGFGLLTVNSAGGSVSLQSYGNSGTSHVLYGKLLAIRLVD